MGSCVKLWPILVTLPEREDTIFVGGGVLYRQGIVSCPLFFFFFFEYLLLSLSLSPLILCALGTLRGWDLSFPFTGPLYIALLSYLPVRAKSEFGMVSCP